MSILNQRFEKKSIEIISGTVVYRLNSDWQPDGRILLKLSFSAQDWKQGGVDDIKVPVCGLGKEGYFVKVNIFKSFGEEEWWSNGYDYSGVYLSLSLSLFKYDKVIPCQVIFSGELPQQGSIASYNINVSRIFQRSYEFQIVPLSEPDNSY